MTVTTRHISSDSDVHPYHENQPDPGISLVKLTRGDRISLRLVAKKGTGHKHAKWSPTTAVSFSYRPPPGNEVDFGVECSGALKPIAVLQSSLLILREKLAEVRDGIRKLGSS